MPRGLWDPADFDTEELSEREILYQTWRCVHSIRSMVMFWILLSLGTALIVLVAAAINAASQSA